jgi:hypothetical protein
LFHTFLGGLALTVLLVLAVNTPFAKARNLNERISLRHRDKIPYGTYVAHQLLQASFSKAQITVDKNAPGYWNGIDPDTSNQAVFLVCKTFEPDNDDLQKLARFVKAGNYVFIITKNLSFAASRFFNLNEEAFYINQARDSLQLSLNLPGAGKATFAYPGKQWDSYLPALDTATVVPLGSTKQAVPTLFNCNRAADACSFILRRLRSAIILFCTSQTSGIFKKRYRLCPKAWTAWFGTSIISRLITLKKKSLVY